MVLRTRVAGALIGVVFGVVLSWSGMTSPEVIREGLLFEDAYLFFFFGGAVTTAFVGLWILRRRAPRALLTGERVQWETVKPERRHIVGSVLFGIGWGVSGACPGPIATQLGQGIAWGVPTTVGLVLGIVLFARLQARIVAQASASREATATSAAAWIAPTRPSTQWTQAVAKLGPVAGSNGSWGSRDPVRPSSMNE